MKREFEDIINSLKNSIASYSWYVDFNKVSNNVKDIEINLNILNYLIGKANFEEEFINLYNKYPSILSVIPILLATRDKKIVVFDEEEIIYDFNNPNFEINKYMKFMDKTGLKELFTTEKIKNLVDYVFGIEVGMDTNARKNRTGIAMEEIVEDFIKNETTRYLVQANKEAVKNKLNSNLLDSFNRIDKKGNPKRFDFVIKTKNDSLLVVEVNFYSGGGSKLNETARSFKELNNELTKLENVYFIWITDGAGWNKTKNNLYDTFLNMEHIYTILDLENGIIEELIEKL